MRLRELIILAVKVGEVSAVLAARHTRVTRIARPALEAAEPLVDVSREAGFAELTVADNVDAGAGLPAHDIGYAFA